MLEEILTPQNIIIYLIAINLIGFVTMWIDKRKAQKGSWRISEQTIFYITLFGRRHWYNSRNVHVQAQNEKNAFRIRITNNFN